MTRQRIELKLKDTKDVHFKEPLYCYMSIIDGDRYSVWHEKLSIRAQATTAQEACEIIKDVFLELAMDIEHKSKYSSLSQREREKLEVIRSVCSI